MTDPILGVAVFIILWWMAFFIMLPLGVRNLDEEGVVAPGSERGAPVRPNLAKKALWAAGLAALAWVAVAVAVQADLFGVRR